MRPLQGLWRTLWRSPLYAIPFALFFGTLYGPSRDAYVGAYLVSLIFALSIGLCIWANRSFVMPRLLDCEAPGASRAQLQVGLSFFAAAVIGSYAAAIIVHFTLVPEFLGSGRSWAISGMYTLLFFGLIGGINYAIMFYRQAVDRARAVEQTRAELARAELRALRAQINPHFLFNTLNSIAELIRVNPDAAEDLTTRLAEVFRYTLQGSADAHVSLGQELAFVRGYLEIERARFGERLRIEESIEPGLDGVSIPGLLLQPIVENAIHHGVATRPEGGRVAIAARRDGGLLTLEVDDDGPGLDLAARPSGQGFGLHSVRERLRAAGPPHALTIETPPEGGTRVRITLPLSSGNGDRT
jgi:two-component sensor histidine kinase